MDFYGSCFWFFPPFQGELRIQGSCLSFFLKARCLKARCLKDTIKLIADWKLSWKMPGEMFQGKRFFLFHVYIWFYISTYISVAYIMHFTQTNFSWRLLKDMSLHGALQVWLISPSPTDSRVVAWLHGRYVKCCYPWTARVFVDQWIFD